MNDINTKLACLFRDIYNENKDRGITYIPHTSVARNIMLLAYESFIKEEIISTIENLSLDRKMSLVDECRTSNEVFTNSSLVERAKMLHVIRTINENT